MKTAYWALLLAAASSAWAPLTALAGSASEAPATEVEKRCEAIALAIEKDIAAKGLGFMDKHFDYDACLDRAFKDLSAPPRLEREFRNGGRDGFQESFGKPLLCASSVKYLRIHRPGRETRFLFRIAPRDGGVNYFDAVFAQSDAESPKIVDFYIYAVGQNLSDTLRQTVLPQLGEPRRSVFEQLTATENEFTDHLNEIAAMVRAVQERDYRSALNLYVKLPPTLQRERLLLTVQLQAAAQVDASAHQAAAERWRKAYPDDPSIDFISLNLCLAKGQHERYFAALDRIEKSLGGDPFLDVVRARQYRKLGQLERAVRSAQTAVERDPSLVDGYDLLLSLSVQQRAFTNTARWLDRWEQATKGDAVSLAEQDSFTEFARSQIGRQWLQERDSRINPAFINKLIAPSPAPVHKLQGIFYSTAKPSAIINGRTVYPGDRLQGGFRVEQISLQNVTLKTSGGESVVLALKQ